MKYAEHIDQLRYYEQDSGPNITYQFVVSPGTMGLMSAGRVRLSGPTTKARDRHAGWDQVYIVLCGQGTIVVAEQRHRVGPGYVVRIPRNTWHHVELNAGDTLDYIYVNAFQSEQALAELIGASSR
ncbi:MAG: cupin domain-containing protein [Verrucomicrobiae bacterium]|nr:cupin domain-containing protein [Verrucomicrobiae bacterium]